MVEGLCRGKLGVWEEEGTVSVTVALAVLAAPELHL